VELQIYPRNLASIPRGVQAQVAPLSIFGNQYVNLVAPPAAAAGHLEAADFIGAYTGSPSSSLQGTTTQLYDLLNAIHPADLDTALTAFAQALNGEGQALGQALAGSANYLGRGVVPYLGNLQTDIGLLAPVNDEIRRSTPDILATLSNSATTAQTITQEEQALHGLLTNGTTAVGQFGDVLTRVQTTLPMLLNESGPLLADVTQNPHELARTLSGLTQFAAAVAAQETAGPYLSVNVNLPVANISAGVNAALGYHNPGSVAAALGPALDPPTYSAANCPDYPGAPNPYCGVGGNAAAGPTTGTVGTVNPLSPPVAAASIRPAADPPAGPTAGLFAAALQDPSGAEMQAVQAIATALNGGQAPGVPALATVVLTPLLSSMVGR
ncbi:MAG TPA: MCE family protein, partial [Acidimicrobiales bacterium]|nr:MCE family protein [Acidimicrobiales bacterium]